MEDDDEFGDLYSDVLLQFQPSSALNPPPEAPKHPSPKRPIDLNVQTDDDKILSGAPNPKPKFNFTFSQHTQNLVLDSTNSGSEPGFTQSSDSRRNSDQEVVKEDGLSEGVRNQASDFPESTGNRFLDSGGGDGDGKLQEMGPKPTDDAGIDFLVEERGDKDDVLAGKNEALIDKEENFVKFDIEEAEELVIPGVSDAADHQGEGNDWDSDSDDDLNIVLNEINHGPMVMDGLADEDDEDGDPLVIVTDSETGHLPMEEREWGEDAAQPADGERKESGEAVKVNGGAVVAPKIGYNSNFTYQPYHSQFKYVRPGAPLMPGAVPVGPAGAPGQVRPPVNMGPVGGFGRGDWRPTGIRNAFPLQKNLHPGFGMNAWGNNTAGRGFGCGLDFTLPSHKTIFEVDIGSFEEKPWRLPGLDMSDFFNFGLNEESWKDYCKQLEQLRVETSMQSKIRVYESGRAEQEYDPDLPPELAAAAGIREISSENVNNMKSDGGQIDLAKGSSDVRPPVPIGRAIQVETSFVERLPSTDTRPLRIRDSDVIIEIVLQGSTDDSSLPGNDVTEQPDNGTSRENFRGGQGTNGEVAEEQNVLPIAYSVRKGKMVGRRSPVMNSIHDNVVERDSLLPYRLDSREQTSAYPGREVVTLHEGRQTKGRASDRSPIMTRSGGTLDKGVLDNQKEDSVESVRGKRSNQLSSPVTVGSAEEPDIEHGDGLRGSCGMSDREEIPLDRTTLTDTHNAENPLPSVKKQKLSSRVEQSSDQETGDGGDLKAARSSENSKARSDSSRDFHKLNDSVDEEVVQRGRPTRTGNMKRPHGEYEESLRRKGHDERREVENHRVVEKGWDDSHSRRDLDPHSARHSHMKTEGLDRRKERENSEGIWQRRDDDPQRRRTRAEDTRNKVREREKMDKDEHLQLRKQLANGNSRGYQDKDVGSRPRERDDNLKSQYESMTDQYSKRRKEEDYLRRDGEKEEILHGHRENPSRRKRERDDALDLRKRDDQVRTRDDNHNSVRHKEDGWIHRERDQMHIVKQSHEESLSKREREERREGVRKSGRAVEEKSWVPHARAKDEYKGTSDIDYDFKDSGRHNEQHKRRIEDGSVSHNRGREDVHARVKDEYKDTSDIDYDLKETSRHNEHLKRRVEDGSVSQRRGREDVHARVKDEYKGTSDIDYDLKDTGRHNERLKRRVEDGSLPQHRGREDVHSTRGSLLNKGERMSRQERESTRRDRGVGGSDNNRAQEKKHKENTRSKDSEGRDRNSVGPATRNQEDQSGHMNEPAILTGTTEQGKHKEDASSDDEQRDSRRGRSKLERWTSHKEMDFGIDSKSSSSSAKIKEIGKYKNGAGKLPEESAKTVETTDDPHPSGDQKDKKDEKSVDGRHLDTVAKLKQRSERFKLPMPSDKEAMVIKKMESEPLLPSPQSGAPEDSEIKSERPPRKRRWISN